MGGYKDTARRVEYLRRYYARPDIRARENERARAWYRAHPERVRETRTRWATAHPGLEKQRGIERRKVLLAFADAAKADGCVDCGEKNLRVLELDHVRGKKVAAVGTMAHGSNLRAFLAELDKCETRCANCHRQITYERRRSRNS